MSPECGYYINELRSLASFLILGGVVAGIWAMRDLVKTGTPKSPSGYERCPVHYQDIRDCPPGSHPKP